MDPFYRSVSAALARGRDVRADDLPRLCDGDQIGPTASDATDNTEKSKSFRSSLWRREKKSLLFGFGLQCVVVLAQLSVPLLMHALLLSARGGDSGDALLFPSGFSSSSIAVGVAVAPPAAEVEEATLEPAPGLAVVEDAGGGLADSMLTQEAQGQMPDDAHEQQLPAEASESISIDQRSLLLYAFGLFCAMGLSAIAQNWALHTNMRMAIRIRAYLIYRCFTATFSKGNQRFIDAAPHLHMIWAAPTLIAVSGGFLIKLLGPTPAICYLCIMGCFMRVGGASYEERLKLCEEVLSHIRVIKYFVWEKAYYDKIVGLREKENREALKQNCIFAATATQIVCMPFLARSERDQMAVCLLTFVFLTLDEMKPEVTFCLMGFTMIMRFPLQQMGLIASNVVQCWVVLDRVDRFLTGSDIRWSSTGTGAKRTANVLENVQLTIDDNDILEISGSTGSGKSTLLQTLLQETMVTPASSFSLSPASTKIAYVSQTAWIRNATIKDNIAFFRYNVAGCIDVGSYELAVWASCLEADFEQLADKDETEIGERGVTLSGGQKMRVALARAVYAALFDCSNFESSSFLDPARWKSLRQTDLALEKKRFPRSLRVVMLFDDIFAALDAGTAMVVAERLLLVRNKIASSQRQRSTSCTLIFAGNIMERPDAGLAINMCGRFLAGAMKKVRGRIKTSEAVFPQTSRKIRIDARTKTVVEVVDPSVDSTNVVEQMEVADIKILPEDVKEGEREPTSPDSSNILEQLNNGQERYHLPKAESAGAMLLNAPPNNTRTTERTTSKAPLNTRSTSTKLMTKEDDSGRIVSLQGALKAWFLALGTLFLPLGIASVLSMYVERYVFISVDVILKTWCAAAAAVVAGGFPPPGETTTSVLIPDGIETVDGGGEAGINRFSNRPFAVQYVVFTMLAFFFCAFTRFSFAFVCTQAGKSLFNDMLEKILCAPVSWFDSTPLGRVINRFSFDTENIDVVLLTKVYPATVCISWVIGSLFVIGAVLFPYNLILLPLFLGSSFYFLTRARTAIVQIQRLDNVSRSPIASLTTETLQGRLLIQTFDNEGNYVMRMAKLIDANSKALFAFNSASRWLGVRVELVVVSNTFLVLCTCVYLQLAAQELGFALLWCSSLGISMAFLSTNLSAAEAAFTSVERVSEYATSLPSEKGLLLLGGLASGSSSRSRDNGPRENPNSSTSSPCSFREKMKNRNIKRHEQVTEAVSHEAESAMGAAERFFMRVKEFWDLVERRVQRSIGWRGDERRNENDDPEDANAKDVDESASSASSSSRGALEAYFVRSEDANDRSPSPMAGGGSADVVSPEQEVSLDDKGRRTTRFPFAEPDDASPDHGLHIQNLKLRYRADLPLTLDGISFSLAPGERCAVVGRTGAGKSSLAVALFRLAEEVTADRMELNGKSLLHGGASLEGSRKRIGIITQTPDVFGETIRYNLDPFGEYTDAECLQALQMAQFPLAFAPCPGDHRMKSSAVEVAGDGDGFDERRRSGADQDVRMGSRTTPADADENKNSPPSKEAQQEDRDDAVELQDMSSCVIGTVDEMKCSSTGAVVGARNSFDLIRENWAGEYRKKIWVPLCMRDSTSRDQSKPDLLSFAEKMETSQEETQFLQQDEAAPVLADQRVVQKHAIFTPPPETGETETFAIFTPSDGETETKGGASDLNYDSFYNETWAAGRGARRLLPDGADLSVGERQLLCLARTLLRDPELLICDEATASVDLETDKKVQQSLKKWLERKNQNAARGAAAVRGPGGAIAMDDMDAGESHQRSSTCVLTIAHRLDTVADYDSALVLDQGRVAEFGKIAELRRNPESLFTQMAARFEGAAVGGL
eukprot:g13912.t1